MYVGMNEFEIEEKNKDIGLETNVVYVGYHRTEPAPPLEPTPPIHPPTHPPIHLPHATPGTTP